MALETVMGMNGITVVPIGDKFFKVVTEATAADGGGPGLHQHRRQFARLWQVHHRDRAIEVRRPRPGGARRWVCSPDRPDSVIYIPSTASLILRDYTENVKRMLEMVEKLDVESPLTIKSKVIPIRYALATDISAALGQLGAAAAGSVGHQSSGAAFHHSTTGPSTPGMGGNQPGTGAFGGQAAQTGLSGGAGGRASNFGQQAGKHRQTAPPAAPRAVLVPSLAARPRSSPTSAPIPSWSSPTTRT